MTTQPHASSESTEGRRKAGNRTTRPPAKGGNGSGAERLSLIGVKVDKALRAEIDEYAKTHGITRSRAAGQRSEEHTSELQSLRHLVCRLLLEKKKQHNNYSTHHN